MSRWGLVIYTLGISLLSTAKGATVYLGGAYSQLDCSRLAAYHGYPYYRYGGYVNGHYIVNACFGITSAASTPQPSQCQPESIATYAWSLSTASTHLTMWMDLSAQKELYGPAIPTIKILASLAHEMKQMADDKNSCRTLGHFFFEELRPAFQRVESEFLPLHNQALDPKVGEQWRYLEQEYRTLRSKL